MRFEILGPVRAWGNGAEIEIGSPQQRVVLAMLLFDAGRPVTVDRLVDGLWGESPPKRAAQVTRTYVSRLRKIVNADRKLLVTEVSGYALHPGDDAIDLTAFESASAAAEDARTRGDLTCADQLLGQALSLWRGEPLAGLPGPWAESNRADLVERRLTTRQARCEVGLELGRHVQEVAELTELCRVHPYRERLRELLMLALHRCGRTAEALGVFADTRKLFDDELGIVPGRELSTMHDRILQDDPELLLWSRTANRITLVPAQLPADTRDFTGRAEMVGTLVAALGKGGTVVVSGMGGVGKTTLAVHAAQLVRAEFGDGQLFVNLRGAGSDLADPVAVLGAFLTALGVADPAMPTGLVERAALYRTMLAGRRVLVLLDNARDAAQVQPLLHGTTGSAVLVTSRARHIVIEGAVHVHLDVMPPDEALLLLRGVVGAKRVDAEREAAAKLIATCGLLPLAIRMVGSRLAARPGWSILDVTEQLSDNQRIMALGTGDVAVVSAFELSYRQLTVEQARAFRLLAVADGPDISLEAGAALLGVDSHAAQVLLESLVDVSLLDSPTYGRYRYHGLLRTFARLRLPDCEARPVFRRLLDYYLATGCTAFQLAVPGDPVTEVVDPPQCHGGWMPDFAHAASWVAANADNLVAVVCQAATATQPDPMAVTVAVQLLVVLCPFNQQLRHVRLEPAVMALCRAVSEDDHRLAGRVYFLRSMVELGLGRPADAEAAARQAIVWCRAGGDATVHCQVLNVLGRINRRRRHFEEALDCYRQSIEFARTAGHRSVEALTMANIAAVLVDRGDAADAVPVCESAMLTATDVDDVNAIVYARYTLGVALQQSGRYAEAADAHRQCLRASDAAGLMVWEAHSLYQLANSLLHLEQPAAAGRYAERALILCRDIGDQVAEAHALTSVAAALTQTGDADRARFCLQSAYQIFRGLGMPAAEDTLRRLRDLAPVSLGRSADGTGGSVALG
ncbi:BTAD domain-containing putative transcriptional regulator [Nocardia sp. NPDC052566]|uniref:AfsR/SARP family transcriptional regulator n=1 Tax=Nocardia sp. NPDC052566 TaxID=3364330 RepID=UPI0037C966C5